MSKLSKQEIYDEDYFERGLITGKSCYLNYRWLPELTIKMTYHIADSLKFKKTDRILDFGCAKGFVVRAFRILGFECFGCDISKYAINKVDSEVKDFCRLNNPSNLIPFKGQKFDWLIAKDVLEHCTEEEIDRFLSLTRKYVQKMFLIIPLGQNNKFIAPEYNEDIGHVLAKNKDWWIDKLNSQRWKIKKFSYKFNGVKDNWTAKYPRANGFFIAKKI